MRLLPPRLRDARRVQPSALRHDPGSRGTHLRHARLRAQRRGWWLRAGLRALQQRAQPVHGSNGRVHRPASVQQAPASGLARGRKALALLRRLTHPSGGRSSTQPLDKRRPRHRSNAVASRGRGDSVSCAGAGSQPGHGPRGHVASPAVDGGHGRGWSRQPVRNSRRWKTGNRRRTGRRLVCACVWPAATPRDPSGVRALRPRCGSRLPAWRGCATRGRWRSAAT